MYPLFMADLAWFHLTPFSCPTFPCFVVSIASRQRPWERSQTILTNSTAKTRVLVPSGVAAATYGPLPPSAATAAAIASSSTQSASSSSSSSSLGSGSGLGAVSSAKGAFVAAMPTHLYSDTLQTSVDIAPVKPAPLTNNNNGSNGGGNSYMYDSASASCPSSALTDASSSAPSSFPLIANPATGAGLVSPLAPFSPNSTASSASATAAIGGAAGAGSVPLSSLLPAPPLPLARAQATAHALQLVLGSASTALANALTVIHQALTLQTEVTALLRSLFVVRAAVAVITTAARLLRRLLRGIGAATGALLGIDSRTAQYLTSSSSSASSKGAFESAWSAANKLSRHSSPYSTAQLPYGPAGTYMGAAASTYTGGAHGHLARRSGLRGLVTVGGAVKAVAAAAVVWGCVYGWSWPSNPGSNNNNNSNSTAGSCHLSNSNGSAHALTQASTDASTTATASLHINASNASQSSATASVTNFISKSNSGVLESAWQTSVVNNNGNKQQHPK